MTNKAENNRDTRVMDEQKELLNKDRNLSITWSHFASYLENCFESEKYERGIQFFESLNLTTDDFLWIPQSKYKEKIF